MAKRFAVGEKFIAKLPFEQTTYEVVSRTETKLTCSYILNQGFDGVQVGYRNFRVNLNCYGNEYISVGMYDDFEFHAYAESESEV